MTTVNFIRLYECQSTIRMLMLVFLLASNPCWSAEPTKVDGPKRISFRKQENSYKASFVHQMDLNKGGVYFVPVIVSSTNVDEFLRSLKITDADGKPVQSYSFHLDEEELAPAVDERLPGVFQGDDFKFAAFQRLLLGKQVTIVARQDGISAELTAEAERNDAQAAELSGKVTASVPATVEVTGSILGLSATLGTVKLLVPRGTDTQIVELKRESIVSLQIAADAVPELPKGLELRQMLATRAKRLILSINEDIAGATISYEYYLPEAYEIEAIGDLSLDPVRLMVSGWIKLRNSTPWDWQDVQVTLVTNEATDSDYLLLNVTLAEGKIVRRPLPQPGASPWSLPGELYLHAAAVSEADSNLAVELKLNVYNRPDPSAMALMADRLLLREGGRILHAIEGFAEIPVSSSPRRLSLGSSDAIEVRATRVWNVPIIAESLSPADGNIVVCHGGRVTLYHIKYKADDPRSQLPVLLARSDVSSHVPIEQRSQYIVKADAIQVVGKKSSLELIELQEPNKTLLLPITEARTDPNVGGLQWLARYAKSVELRQALLDAAAIRLDIDQLEQELALLESQLLTLQNRQSTYLRSPQTKHHGTIVRHFEDHIYAKDMHIDDKRSELTNRRYQLDQLAGRSGGIR